MIQSYSTTVIREKTAGPPFLIEGEAIIYQTKHVIRPTAFLIACFVTFLPPFIWGVLLLTLAWFNKRNTGVWLTNYRLISFDKFIFSRQYLVTSIPLGEISKVRRAPSTDVLEFFTNMIERMLGMGDLQVFVRDSKIVQCSITDIKNPDCLLDHIRKLSNAD